MMVVLTLGPVSDHLDDGDARQHLVQYARHIRSKKIALHNQQSGTERLPGMRSGRNFKFRQNLPRAGPSAQLTERVENVVERG